MEIGLTALIACRSATQRGVVLRMLSVGPGRSVREDGMDEAERVWLPALEFVEQPEHVAALGDIAVAAGWTLGDEEDAVTILEALRDADVTNIYAAMQTDEGWAEIWVMDRGRITRHENWRGTPVLDLLEAADDPVAVLASARASAGA